MEKFFTSPWLVFVAATLLRVVLFSYGLWQDSHSPLKYTDIDYYVFTDAARSVDQGGSPYDRATYRYTPLLAWMLVPTARYSGWFSAGKLLFALCDLVAGWFMVLILRSSHKMDTSRSLRYASIWLLNPMVATISTRGSSEGLLGLLVVATLWALLDRHHSLAGVLLGLGVHFKIYPFIYAFSVMWWLDSRIVDSKSNENTIEGLAWLKRVCNKSRMQVALGSLSTFGVLTVAMYSIYGWPFFQHTYLYHITRLDHRHNFSPYNILLYLTSDGSFKSSIGVESMAFFPQLFLSTSALPLLLAKKDLPSTLLAQTFAFVAFNKVCTSQYFLWYTALLPFYLPTSSLVRSPGLGVVALLLWVLSQAAWLQQAYQLEFLGISTFVPGLLVGADLFFLVNVWLLGIIITDIGLPFHANLAALTSNNSVGFMQPAHVQ